MGCLLHQPVMIAAPLYPYLKDGLCMGHLQLVRFRFDWTRDLQLLDLVVPWSRRTMHCTLRRPGRAA